MENRLRENLFQAVKNVNDKLVLDGMDAALERFVPLLEITSMASEFIVYFFGQAVFNSEENIMLEGMYDVHTIEKVLIQNISDVRSVMNHVTVAIHQTGC
jgi:hypothetical protein